jgi:hypothetical protein
MLTHFELENFKAFGRRASIPLSPITLIFGENSAGKSSILQALSLLKQTRESREAGVVLLPRSDQGIVDLGSFREMLFDHDPDRTLRFRLNVDDISGPQHPLLREVHEGINTVGVECAFVRPSEIEEVRVDEWTLLLDSRPVVKYRPADAPTSMLHRPLRRYYRTRNVDTRRLRAARCTWVTEDEEFWESFYTRALSEREKVYSELNKMRDRYETHSSLDRYDILREEEELDSDEEKSSPSDALHEALAFYESDFSIEDYIKRTRTAQATTYVVLDGFLPISINADDRAFPELNPRLSRIRYRGLPNFGLLTMMAGRELEQALESLFPLGPFRTPPERWYIFTGTSPQDVGYEGQLLPDLLYRKKEVLRQANGWLDRLDIGYDLQVMSAGARLRDLFEVRLKDKRRGETVDVSLSDVGFGISQILPFIVQSLAAENQIISIEQPEVHIHPRLQADLGDLLASSVRERNNQFLIETHSEHLILRLQRLVREGKLEPDEVSVIYVSRGKEGSRAERLRLDEDGDFVDHWPGGFFPERLRELI